MESFLIWLCLVIVAGEVMLPSPRSWAAVVPADTAAGKDTVPDPGPLNGKEAQSLLEKMGGRLCVVDVRTPAEFEEGHIKEALSIPVQDILKNIALVPVDRPLLLICRSGGRAAFAYNLLHKTYPENRKIWYLDGSPEYRPDGSYIFH